MNRVNHKTGGNPSGKPANRTMMSAIGWEMKQ